ncbi:MAG: hypothetical protein AAF414_03500 [Pseudomonadota bacterium]
MLGKCAVSAIVGITAMMSGGVALAQDGTGPECGVFVHVAEVDARHFVDHGDDGPSPGDQRLSSHTLYDSEGNEVGTYHVAATLLPQAPGDDHVFHATIVSTYPNGTITGIALASPPNPEDTSRGPHRETVRSVTGGSGDFAHATGTMTSIMLDGGRQEITYDLICHD